MVSKAAHHITHIKDILAIPTMGAYYYDDLTALQATPMRPSR